MMDFSDQCHQSSRFSFLQLLEENNWRIEELQSFDSFRSKLCGLEEQPTQEAEQHNIAQGQFVETPHMQVDSISRETCEIRTQHPNYAEDSVLLTSTVASDEICGKSNPMTSDHDETPMQANSGSNSEKPLDNRLATSDNFMCGGPSKSSSGTCTQSKRKRKRSNKCSKNSEEVESQRQTHIAVERNRRKQMNEHLSILRSLMPGSYVLRVVILNVNLAVIHHLSSDSLCLQISYRLYVAEVNRFGFISFTRTVMQGDQASIVGGAIEFVKELEQLLECLQVQKRRRTYAKAFSPKPNILLQPTFPVYPLPSEQSQVYSMSADSKYVNDNFYEPVMREVFAESKSGLAEVEVKVVGSVAFVKILSQRRPGQLLKTIEALEGLCLTIVHTNITTIEQTVLYSFNVTLGAECILKVDEIAAAVQHIFTMIHNSSSTM